MKNSNSMDEILPQYLRESILQAEMYDEPSRVSVLQKRFDKYIIIAKYC